VAAAEVRIMRVLEKRGVCYSKELERQVCEVGFNFAVTPAAERPEPVHYGEAIGLLRAAHIVHLPAEVLDQAATFYARADLPPGERAKALAQKIRHVTAYQRVERIPDIAGYHAETILHGALVASEAWRSVGHQPGRHIVTLHDRTLAEREGDADIAAFDLAGGHPMVASVKNTREWYYETADVVWELLGVAAKLRAVPILLCRRYPETLPRLMRLVGGFAYRTVKMVYPPEAATMPGRRGEPSFMEALEALGFHTDALFVPAGEVRPGDLKLWREVLPPRIEDMYDRFTALAPEIEEIAYGEGLRSKRVANGRASGKPRRQIVAEFMAELRRREEKEEL
jgi:hypothetical protein